MASTDKSTCANCRWYIAARNGPNYTRRRPEKLGWGICSLAEGGDEPEHKQALAYAGDGSGYWAVLYVSPEFGCVQWEAK